MKTPQERYLSDPQFHILVDVMEKHIRDAEYTPSEIREAAVLACIHYEQMTIRPIFIPKERIET